MAAKKGASVVVDQQRGVGSEVGVSEPAASTVSPANTRQQHPDTRSKLPKEASRDIEADLPKEYHAGNPHDKITLRFKLMLLVFLVLVAAAIGTFLGLRKGSIVQHGLDPQLTPPEEELFMNYLS